jgi:hypothetical protein
MADEATAVTLTFTRDDLKVLNDALIALPFRVAAPVIGRINQQIVAAAKPPGDSAYDDVSPDVAGTADLGPDVALPPNEVKSRDQRHDG